MAVFPATKTFVVDQVQVPHPSLARVGPPCVKEQPEHASILQREGPRALPQQVRALDSINFSPTEVNSPNLCPLGGDNQIVQVVAVRPSQVQLIKVPLYTPIPSDLPSHEWSPPLPIRLCPVGVQG